MLPVTKSSEDDMYFEHFRFHEKLSMSFALT